jgi:hypothetical protein
MEVGFEPVQEGDIADILAMMRALYAIDSYPFDEAIARAALLRLSIDPALG